MPKATTIEERLAEVAELRNAPDTPDRRRQIRKHLSSKTSLIVARAAQIAAGIEGHEFIPDLISAFHRFVPEAAKNDKGCAAKTAVVKAMLALDCGDDEVFQIGIKHVQLEPTWGGRADTAAPLRALCGLGLVQIGSPDAMNRLAVLLADKEGDARIGAANALGHCGPTAAPLLRFKVMTGDQEPAVLAECLTALMSLSPSGSYEFVGGFVDPEYPSLYEHAALALSESRLPQVFDLFKEKWTSTFDREFKGALLLPIALIRSDESREFLMSVVEMGDVRMATAAIAALRIYRDDEKIRRRTEEAISGPNRTQLLEVLRREFD